MVDFLVEHEYNMFEQYYEKDLEFLEGYNFYDEDKC